MHKLRTYLLNRGYKQLGNTFVKDGIEVVFNERGEYVSPVLYWKTTTETQPISSARMERLFQLVKLEIIVEKVIESKKYYIYMEGRVL